MARLKRQLSEHNFLYLARRYYQREDFPINTVADLAKLSPRQLNNLTNWATNTDPESQARIKGRKYTGRTYGKLKKIF